MFLQLAQAAGHAVAIEIASAGKQAEPKLADPFGNQAWTGRLEKGDEQIGLPLVDIDRLCRGHELHVEQRRNPAQVAKTLREIERGDAFHGCETDVSCKLLGVAGTRLLADGDDRALDPLGMPQQPFTGLVELEARAVTFEHCDSE